MKGECEYGSKKGSTAGASKKTMAQPNRVTKAKEPNPKKGKRLASD